MYIYFGYVSDRLPNSMSSINIKETELDGVYLIKPEIHKDSRGSLFESFRADI